MVYKFLFFVFQIFIPITCQDSLDAAIHVVDKNEKITSLRLFLTNSGSPYNHNHITDSNKSHVSYPTYFTTMEPPN